MRSSSSKSRRFVPAMVAVLVVAPGNLTGCAGQPDRAAPNPLPADLVAAWKTAGAEVGWMPGGFLSQFSQEKQGRPGPLPAFRFRHVELKEGSLGKLPAPEAPFGLCLEHTKLGNAVLKELASLKQVERLQLEWIQIPDQGELKELAGLPQLRSLDLIDWSV